MTKLESLLQPISPPDVFRTGHWSPEFLGRAVLTVRNSQLKEINDTITEQLPGHELRLQLRPFLIHWGKI